MSAARDARDKTFWQFAGIAPAPPPSLVWGCWQPPDLAVTPLDPEMFFTEDDPQARIVWAVAGGKNPPPRPFLGRHWCAVRRVEAVDGLNGVSSCKVIPCHASLPKIGGTEANWYLLPGLDLVTWVNASKLLDPLWRQQQQLFGHEDSAKPKPKRGFFGGAKEVSVGPDQAILVAAKAILALVDTSSVDLSASLWSCLPRKEDPRHRSNVRITEVDLVALGSDNLQLLLVTVACHWLELNVNVQYVRARQAIARRSHTDAQDDTQASKPHLVQTLARQRFNEKHLIDLRLAVQECRVEVGRAQSEVRAITSGKVRLVPAETGGTAMEHRTLDVVDIPWHCAWSTMQNRMQQLTGHNNDDLYFIFHSDVDVDLIGHHDLLASLREVAVRKAGATGRRVASSGGQRKRLQGMNTHKDPYVAASTGPALKTHPKVAISKVEAELIKLSDLVLEHRYVPKLLQAVLQMRQWKLVCSSACALSPQRIFGNSVGVPMLRILVLCRTGQGVVSTRDILFVTQVNFDV